jgi:hypothetical protein
MAQKLRDELGRLLDGYDARRSAEQVRVDKAKQADAQFLAEFATLRREVVRPVFEEAGALLAARGHRFSIVEREFAADPAGKVTEASIALSVVPAGIGSAEAESHAWTLSVSTRHYNKTVWFDAGAAMNAGGFAGSKGAYALQKVDARLTEDEVVKFIAGVVAA